MRYLIAAVAIAFASAAQAASVNKCVGPDGKITFTQQACPDSNLPGEEVRIRSAGPSYSASVDGRQGSAAEREHYRAVEIPAIRLRAAELLASPDPAQQAIGQELMLEAQRYEAAHETYQRTSQRRAEIEREFDQLSNDMRQPQAEQPKSQPRVTVVGGSEDKMVCSTGLSDRDLRAAKVRGEIVPGMSRKDVESIYGKPNRDGAAHGAGTSTYWNDKYLEMTSVNYDSNGCVRSTYQSGHKP
jgi:hypothetical protein